MLRGISSLIFKPDRAAAGKLYISENGCYATIQKADNCMPDEKEININLFERLELVERIRREAERGGLDAVMAQLDIEQKAIERKLYQQPPLTQQTNPQ